MKQFYLTACSSISALKSPLYFKSLLCGLLCSIVTYSEAQSVSGVITDYNNYWKTSVSSVNAVKPVNSHNLLAFTYNSVQYSTGVNDLALSSHGESFIAGDFWSLPLSGFTGAITSNTKVGVGEMYDGVHNGASHPAPVNNIGYYLSDGIKGLNIGTGIANLPAGSMSFNVSTINPLNIGDGIPDILVTQIADPSGSTDGYSFIDASGTIVGYKKNIAFTSITPVANWTADFYEASSNPLTLTTGYTNTDRPLRLWAADLSDFGITSTNYSAIQKFTITLSGNSDVAFVSYNNKSFNVIGALPLSLADFSCKQVSNKTQLNWSTTMEENTSHFTVERSIDNNEFTAIADVKANSNSTTTRKYTHADNQPAAGTNYYRLKMVDKDGSFTYSKIIMINFSAAKLTVSLYPNPSSDNVFMTHPATSGATIKIYNASGVVVLHTQTSANSQQSKLNIQSLVNGIYFVVWQNGTDKISMPLAKK